jgi:hypothetical protein
MVTDEPEARDNLDRLSDKRRDSSFPQSMLSNDIMTDIMPLDIENSKAEFPSEVVQVSYGKALCATSDLEPGTIVHRFLGPEVKYDNISEHDKCYVLNTQKPGSTECCFTLTQGFGY